MLLELDEAVPVELTELVDKVLLALVKDTVLEAVAAAEDADFDEAAADCLVVVIAEVEAAFVALDVAAAVGVNVDSSSSSESSVVALFPKSCFAAGIVHSCINHTASLFSQPP